jgi:anaerobic selenocysteine-containing dehydrogenase
MAEPQVDTSPRTWDRVEPTTCYMCACRCGIKVYLKDGLVRYIEGNRDHPVNRGVLCGKGSAGIMQHTSPARLSAPLMRVGPRGSGEFREVSWEEALRTATMWLSEVRASDPRKLAFFTGRDQSQALTGWWAKQFGTPNYAAHGGFCSVNMAAAGLYTFGGSFWEFSEPDWEHARYFLLFGVAEDHASNPLKIGLGRLKARGVKVVSVNPVRTGYSAIADEWVGVAPGSDGLFVAALIHELLSAGRIDTQSLARHTNAGWLVIDHPGADDDGLIARDDEGSPLCVDHASGRPVPASGAVIPRLSGEVALEGGRKGRPAFELLARRFLTDDYSPDAVAARTGVAASTIRRIAAELVSAAFDDPPVLAIPWTDAWGRRHETMVGRPVAMHAMRGISAHSNGFHTCRIIHLLQMLLGTIDAPGGFRYRPPYPKRVPPPVKPAGRPGEVNPGRALPGPHLGFPVEPSDLLIDDKGEPLRLDKAFSWEAPFAAHGLMHTVISNAARRDPYGIEVLFLYMANMSWNSSMNVPGTIEQLTRRDEATGEYTIPRIIYSDAYASEMVSYADLVLPDTTYLERYDCISLLDRPISEADGCADSIRRPVVAPNRNVRPFQDVLLDLGARLGLEGMVDEKGEPRYVGGYADYMVNHERLPGIGPLAGWRGADGAKSVRGEPNPRQLERYVENGCFWFEPFPAEARYFKHVNRAYLDLANKAGFIDGSEPIVFHLYSEPMQRFRLAARGHGAVQPPERHRARIEAFFDPLPFWYPPFEEETAGHEAYPLHAVTQRPMAMYHSWGSQNAWLRQIIGRNWLYLARSKAEELGIGDGDWVHVTSRHGRITVPVKLMDGVNPDTVWTWNAIGKRSGAWNLSPDSPEARKGFLLNHLIPELLPEGEGGYRYSNSDPVTGQAAWYDLKVRIEKASPAVETVPQFATLRTVTGLKSRPTVVGRGAP